MNPQREATRRIARALAKCECEEEVVVKCISAQLDGNRPRWVRPLCRRYLVWRSSCESRVRVRDIVEWIREDGRFSRAWMQGKVDMQPAFAERVMKPAPGAPVSWKLPAILELEQLAKELQVDLRDLNWLSNHFGPTHYLYRWQEKAHSGAGRLIEVPKPMLKRVQRRILHHIVTAIPPHESAHGFLPGRSVHSYVESHVGKEMVLRVDLRDFFPSIMASRVHSLFLTAGYPEGVADCLTSLVTHRASWEVIDSNPYSRSTSREQVQQYLAPHLPQGAPSSPALANLCAFRLDCRLAGLARKAGVDYTRYADDLLFSGDSAFARGSEAFTTRVQAIVLEEGFRPNYRKTRRMPSSQRQKAGGIVLNERPNLSRQEFDRLKAILTNCLRSGPKDQNREGHPDFRAHLQGRIAWAKAIQEAKGERLQKIFDQIQWEDGGG